jgi:hypothetical protein
MLADLKDFVSEQDEYSTTTSRAVEELKNKLTYKKVGVTNRKAFYATWNTQNHEERFQKSKGNCCFWHILGPAQKDGKDMPMLLYQRLLYNALQEYRCVWIKKSRGIGVTTYLLYWIAYCCLAKWQPGDRVCVAVGPRIDLAEDFISRFKNLFRRNFPEVYSELTKQQSTVAVLNGVKVEAFPSHHVDTMRGLDRVKFIMSDESDYYPPFQQREVRAVMEGYIGKPNSDPTIIICSTPRAPGGLLQEIELEKNSLYYRLFLTYEYGLEGDYPIYSKEQIELARKSPDFPREFEGKYLGQIGNVISPIAIDRCLSLGEEMAKTTPIDNWDISARYVMGIDAAWGGESKFSCVIARYVNGKVQIVYSKEMERPIFQDAINEIKRLVSKCHYGEGIQNIILDAGNVEVYTTLCQLYNQNPSLQYLKEQQHHAKKVNRPLEEYLFVTPVPFSTQHKNLLAHLKRIIEDTDSNGTAIVAIHPKFTELVTALRTSTATELDLDKSATVSDDTLDAARLALSYFRFKR